MKKLHTIHSICLSLVLCVFLYSCVGLGPYTAPYYVPIDRQKANHYYAPTITNAPLLANKNDISFSFSGAMGSENLGPGLQAAYIAGEHIGVTASYSALSNSDWLDNMSDQHVFEFGAGYVNRLSERWLFESYGGMGFGKMENTHETGRSTIKTTNYFVQPAIAVSSKKDAFQFGLFSKFNIVNFSLGDTSFDNDREPFVTNQMKIIADKPVHVYWEPGFVVRGGWKWLLLQAAYQVSTDCSNSGLRKAQDNFSMGIMVRLNTAKKKK